MPFQLKTIVPWGRLFDEYVNMFGLTDEDLHKDIIGCGDGPAGFNAGMKRRGFYAVSCDPLYKYSASQIGERIGEVYGEILEQLKANRQDYVWQMFRTPEEVGEARMQAMQDFLADYPEGKKERRYVEESLPVLSFANGRFDLALCSHFLFLYTPQLSLDFHLEAVREMCRVAEEVRIFPLLDLGCRESPYVGPVRASLEKEGFRTGIERVDYEFQRGGDKMLKIRRA